MQKSINRLLRVAFVFGLGLTGEGVDAQVTYGGYGNNAVPVASDAEKAAVTFIDEHGDKQTFDADDLNEMPRRKVKTSNKGLEKLYEGVSLVDVLKHFGVGFGETLRGKRTPTVVLCEARDGYRVALSLVEIDPATTDGLVLLADRCDEQALGVDEGPFRFIIPSDKRGVRSIRMLQTIRVVNLADMPMTHVFDEIPASQAK